MTSSDPIVAGIVKKMYGDPDDAPPQGIPRPPSAADVVARAMYTFWYDEARSYKASDADSIHHAEEVLQAAGYDVRVYDMQVAADISYALREHGIDAVTDPVYHVVIAALLTGAEVN